MTALTVRLPDDKHIRVKALARDRGTSVNRSIEEVQIRTLETPRDTLLPKLISGEVRVAA